MSLTMGPLLGLPICFSSDDLSTFDDHRPFAVRASFSRPPAAPAQGYLYFCTLWMGAGCRMMSHPGGSGPSSIRRAKQGRT